MIHRVPSNGEKEAGLENALQLKQLELNSLLEVTQAINYNLPEESLYKIFYFTLIANLKIKKFALYVFDAGWSCKVNYGTKANFKSIELDETFFNVSKISKLEQKAECQFSEFDLLIPVAHKSQLLAIVFIGGLELGEENTDVSFVQTFANIITVAIENKKLARKELQQEAFRKELEIARDVQSHLFPKSLPNNERIVIQADYLPHHSIGGDYYDYVPLSDNEFFICVADVSGKGIPAALLMSNFQACLRTMLRQTSDLKKIVTELNYITRLNARGERFITFFAMIVDLKSRKARYINAGHNPAIIIQKGEATTLENGTTILGIFEDLPFLSEDELSVDENSLLFLYTDGVTETSNPEEEEFGVERFIEFLQQHSGQENQEIHKGLMEALNTFKGNKAFPDDITFVSCRIKGF
jgi:sigma-B regulation protein RsbU (phosphoserine phosphatase)